MSLSVSSVNYAGKPNQMGYVPNYGNNPIENSAETKTGKLSTTEKVLIGAGALALAAIGAYAIVKGKGTDIKKITWDKGTAMLNGEKFTGTIKSSQNGKVVKMTCENGVIKQSVIKSGDDVITKTFDKNEAGDKIVKIVKNGKEEVVNLTEKRQAALERMKHQDTPVSQPKNPEQPAAQTPKPEQPKPAEQQAASKPEPKNPEQPAAPQIDKPQKIIALFKAGDSDAGFDMLKNEGVSLLKKVADYAEAGKEDKVKEALTKFCLFSKELHDKGLLQYTLDPKNERKLRAFEDYGDRYFSNLSEDAEQLIANVLLSMDQKLKSFIMF